MSASCNHQPNFTGASDQYKRILLVVILINLFMFVVEMSFGFAGDSQALKADALDFLSDSATYALTLWGIGQSVRVTSNIALIKGVSLFLIAAWVLGSTIYYSIVMNQPSAPIMGSVALAALTANVISVLLLMKYREGNANVRSVWLCSRNDAIANVAVIIASILVYYLSSHWPDLIVALILSALFVSSAVQIIKQALNEKANS